MNFLSLGNPNLHHAINAKTGGFKTTFSFILLQAEHIAILLVTFKSVYFDEWCTKHSPSYNVVKDLDKLILSSLKERYRFQLPSLPGSNI